MTTLRQACCSSPSSMCYWCLVSFLAWGVLSLIGMYWYPLHGSSAVTICFAVGIGCAINWLRNRTLHCAITGPLFFIVGGIFRLSDVRVFAINPRFVWVGLAIMTGGSVSSGVTTCNARSEGLGLHEARRASMIDRARSSATTTSKSPPISAGARHLSSTPAARIPTVDFRPMRSLSLVENQD